MADGESNMGVEMPIIIVAVVKGRKLRRTSNCEGMCESSVAQMWGAGVERECGRT